MAPPHCLLTYSGVCEPSCCHNPALTHGALLCPCQPSVSSLEACMADGMNFRVCACVVVVVAMKGLDVRRL